MRIEEENCGFGEVNLHARGMAEQIEDIFVGQGFFDCGGAM